MSGLQIGELLDGKYRLDRMLGEGGMGVVAAGTHLTLDRPVAIKAMHASLAADAEATQRFLREARAVARLKSEHVAHVFDVFVHKGTPYIVMELLEGKDLRDLLDDGGPLELATAVEYVLQACDALAEAHAEGIVHRDLKPSNLFLTTARDGRAMVKVLDFGVSKLVEEATPELTRSRAIIGSPRYMSPEQLRASREVDARGDIWSLGVVLYELLTGELPYDARTDADLIAKVLTEPPRPLAELRPDLPPEIEQILHRCLEKDREARYPNVAELALALEAFAAASTRGIARRLVRIVERGSVPAPRRTPTPPARASKDVPTAPLTRPRPFPAFALIGALLGAGAIAGVVVLVTQSKKPVTSASACSDTRSDARHCGRCGHACLGGTCVDGACQPMVLAEGVRPFHLAIDREAVFFSDPINRQIARVPKIGGTVRVLAKTSPLCGLVIDETDVYWCDAQGVRRCSKSGCGAEPALVVVPPSSPRLLRQRGGTLYWTAPASRAVFRAPKSGGSPAPLVENVSKLSYALSVDESFVYFANEDGEIFRAPLAGGTPTRIASGPDSPVTIAADRGAVHWTTLGADGTVGRVPRDAPGKVAAPLVIHQDHPFGLTVDEARVYWVTVGDFSRGRKDGTVSSCRHESCDKADILAGGLHSPRDVAVDDEAIYFSVYGNGQNDGLIMKVAKP